MATFPQAPIGAEVDFYLGSWTDVSTRIYQRTPIQINRGRPNTASQIQSSSATLALKNADGRFSVNNPVGPYYGQLVQNTPVRLSLPNSLLPSPYNTTYLRMEDDGTSYASCPAASRIELTGSIDVRVDVAPSGYGDVVLASVWQASSFVNQRSWYLRLTRFGVLTLAYTTGGSLATYHAVSSTSVLPPPLGRVCYRATLDATTGNIAFYTAPAGTIDAGPWTQLGSTITGSGAVTLFASTTAPLSVGYSTGIAFDDSNLAGLQGWQIPTGVNGAVYDFELRSGIGGTVVARGAFNTQNAGATSWTDSSGNTWGLTGTAALSGRSYRYHGEYATAVKGTDPTGSDVFVNATLAGILQRLQQGQSPLDSPMYRAWVREPGIYAPAAYWPCEDGSSATQIASGLGGTPMVAIGSPQMASASGFVCSNALPVLNGAILTGAVPSGVTWNANVIRMLLQVASGGEANGAVVASIYTTGTAMRLDLVYASAASGSLTFNAYSATGSLLWSLPGTTYNGVAVNGQPGMVELNLQSVSGSLQGGVNAIGVGQSGSFGTTASVSGSIGAVTRVVVNPNGTLTQTAVGHIAVQSNWDGGLVTLWQPLTAWFGEAAGTRILRLCYEEGIASRIYGHPELTVAMGYQSISTLSSLLQECEDADRGMLLEPRTCLALGYRTRMALCNLAATVTASYPAAAFAQGLAPTADYLMVFNDVTAANRDGSSGRQFLASGPMSVQAPPNGVSRVTTSVPVNIQQDGQLASLAGWILHVSTDSHDRVPVLPFNMARSETPAAVALLDIGDLLVATSPPAWIQADEIDQLCAGFAESFGPFGIWEIDVNGAPAYPYTVAQVAGAGGVATHADTDGSQLHTGVNSTATSLSISTTAGFPIWTTSAGDFPFDVRMAGERMTVTNITGTSSPQTFTVTRSVNGVVKAQSAGAAVSLWYPAIVGL